MILLLGLSVKFFDAYILTLIASRFCIERWKSRWAKAGFIILIGFVATLVSSIMESQKIQLMIRFIMILAFLSLFYKRKPGVLLSAFVWLILLEICEFISLTILSFIKNLHTESILFDDNVRTVIMALLANLMEYVVTFLLVYRRKGDVIRKSFQRNQFLSIVLSMIMIIHVVVFYNYTISGLPIPMSFINYFAICIVSYFIFMMYLQYRYTVIAIKQEEQCLMDARIRMLEEHTKESKAIQEHIEQLNHDYRFHLQTLQEMVDNSFHKEANECYNQVTEHFHKIDTYFIENHIMISVLFMQMAKKAKKEGVDFKCMAPKSLKFRGKDTEMNIILSNLLENAFEAVNNLKHGKWINVNLRNMNEGLLIFVENPVGASVRLKGAGFKSTKKSPGKHGYGLKSVERVVKEYDGIMDIEEKDNVFSVAISIPNK